MLKQFVFQNKFTLSQDSQPLNCYPYTDVVLSRIINLLVCTVSSFVKYDLLLVSFVCTARISQNSKNNTDSVVKYLQLPTKDIGNSQNCFKNTHTHKR